MQTFFESLSGFWGYTFLFASALGENLFPPMPGDTFLIVGAFMVGRGQLSFFPAYLATTAGSLLGFMILFWAGYRWGRSFLEGRSGRVFSADHLRRVDAWFQKYGLWVIGGNRFLSGFRSVISLAAGISRMDPIRVFLLALISCVVWNAVLMGAGIWIGDHWIVLLHHYQRIVIGIILVSLLVYIVRLWMKKRT